MASSSCRPVGITWEYDRVELIADGIVHALGVSLGLVGAIAIVILMANSISAADTLSVVIYTIGLLTMLGFRPPTTFGRFPAQSWFCGASITLPSTC
jgi:hemolysin III